MTRVSRADRIAIVALCAIAAAILWPLRTQGLQINDDGWYLHPVLRMIGGETLYRDVHTFYAPFQHHLFAWILGATGPSLLVARTVWLGLLVAGVAVLYRVGRRLAPLELALVPPAVFALVPGQWSKAFYTLCTALFFLALARFLEQRSAARALGLGLAVGFTLVTRHDLGFAQGGLAALALGVPWLRGRPRGPGADAPVQTPGEALRLGAAIAAGVLAFVLPVVVRYASAGALDDLVDATLVRGVLQRSGSYLPGLVQLLSPRTFLHVAEGRVAGFLLILPPLLYAAVLVSLVRRVRRSGFDAEAALVAALWLYALAGLLNTYYQMRLLRLLETGAPFWLLAAWLAAPGAGAARRMRAVRATALGAAGAAFAALVIFAVPRVLPSDDYSGSLRALRFDAPVAVFGETFYVEPDLADEIRMVRGYVGAHVPPDEPIFVGQVHSLYYLLLERRNPTRVLGSHLIDDRILSDAEKEREMARLLEAGTRVVVADQSWLAWPDPPDAIRRTLLERFHPVRQYGSMTVLERGDEPAGRELGALHRRLSRGEVRAGDATALERLAAADPAAPLPRALLALPLLAANRAADAARSLEAAAALDPGNAALLETAARIWIQAGRLAPAAEDLRRALAIRESAASRALLDDLESRLGPPPSPSG